MSVEILKQIPISGNFPEKHFGQTFNSQLWVKFTDNNFQEWVGCFPRPCYPTFNKVLTDNANETAFIVAGGQCYLIDITTKELLHKTDELPIFESAIHTTNPEYFLAGAYSCIYIFSDRKFIKCYEPNFLVNGIYFTEQKGQKAIGDLHSYEFHQDLNVGFEFDLNTNEIVINKDIKIRRFGTFESVIVTEKGGKENENMFTKIFKRLIGK